MAHAALVSLKQTIHLLLNSSRVSISPPSREFLNDVSDEAHQIQELLEGMDKRFKNSLDAAGRRRTKAFHGRMRDAASVIEDALETHVLDTTLLAEQEIHTPLMDTVIPLDLTDLKQDFVSLTHSLNDYLLEKQQQEEEEEENDGDDDDDVGDDDDGGGGGGGGEVTSTAGFVGNESRMVGFADVFCVMRDQLLATEWRESSIEMVSILGMGGTGKTTLAKEIFEDPSIRRAFDHRLWLDVGQKYRVLDIVKHIHGQLRPDDEFDVFSVQNFSEHFTPNERHLVVFDDVWDTHLFSHFRDSFRNDSSRMVLILSTTRLEYVGATAMDNMLKLRPLDKEESWDLLRDKVFGEMTCPSRLERAGKKIAEKCEGLPLTIVTVADILSRTGDMAPEYWNKVAEKENSVFTDAYDRISDVLYPSYDYIPLNFKALYLYLAAFPQNYDITVTKLNMLWAGEGLFESKKPNASISLEDFVLFSLVSDQRATYNNELKACSLSSVFWHLCVREAREDKLFHVLRSYADGTSRCMRNQRRLCVHNNVLFGIKDVHESVASVSATRALLCTGPHHPYPVPICFGRLRLLRVIDALTIRFYEFPVEVLNLLLLRYLGLIYDGKLPPSISKLWNLRFLIVRRHLSIVKLHDDESYLPVEIWDMKELKHLQVTGSNLPDPRDGAILPNLVTLKDVNARSCTRRVLDGLPNLEKFRIRIEPFGCFDDVSYLTKLESLKCVVVNPKFKSDTINAPLTSNLIFSECLQKLSLSGLGYRWEDARAIASLPNLEVLKLRCYAFRGPEWETRDEDFPRLRWLVIEDTDLVHWIVGSGSFQWLECLILTNCYKLDDIHGEFGESLESIEIIDCNPSVVSYAKRLQKDSNTLELTIHSSWDDGKLKHYKVG